MTYNQLQQQIAESDKKFAEMEAMLQQKIDIEMASRLPDRTAVLRMKEQIAGIHGRALRAADKERLGVDMSDRVKVMRNFVEFVGTGWGDTRPPRKGEKHDQIILRTPASWLRGHTVNVGDRFVNIYRTFYTDRSMSYAQLKDVRSFKKFADAKMNRNK